MAVIWNQIFLICHRRILEQGTSAAIWIMVDLCCYDSFINYYSDCRSYVTRGRGFQRNMGNKEMYGASVWQILLPRVVSSGL